VREKCNRRLGFQYKKAVWRRDVLQILSYRMQKRRC